MTTFIPDPYIFIFFRREMVLKGIIRRNKNVFNSQTKRFSEFRPIVIASLIKGQMKIRDENGFYIFLWGQWFPTENWKRDKERLLKEEDIKVVLL